MVRNPFFEGFFFDFDEKKIQKKFPQRKAGTTEREDDRKRERRNEEVTDWGNNWNDTTSALFKNLVLHSCPPLVVGPQARMVIMDPHLPIFDDIVVGRMAITAPFNVGPCREMKTYPWPFGRGQKGGGLGSNKKISIIERFHLQGNCLVDFCNAKSHF